MSGNRQGGIKARDTNLLRHGNNFYSIIGTKGGSTPTSTPKGFAADRERAIRAGKLGGAAPRRRAE